MIFAENGEAVETPVRNEIKTFFLPFFLPHLIEDKVTGDDRASGEKSESGALQSYPAVSHGGGGLKLVSRTMKALR